MPVYILLEILDGLCEFFKAHFLKPTVLKVQCLAEWNLRWGLRRGFQKNIHQFSRCALSGVISHCSWSWYCPPSFAAFLGLELKNSWGLDVIFRDKGRLLYLAAECWASLFSCLSFSVPRVLAYWCVSILVKYLFQSISWKVSFVHLIPLHYSLLWYNVKSVTKTNCWYSLVCVSFILNWTRHLSLHGILRQR